MILSSSQPPRRIFPFLKSFCACRLSPVSRYQGFSVSGESCESHGITNTFLLSFYAAAASHWTIRPALTPSPTIVSGLGNGLLSAMRPRRAAAVTHTKAVTQPVRLRVLRPAAYPTVHPPPQSTIRLPQPLSWQTQAVPIGHIDPNTSPRGLISALSRRAPPMREAIAKCQLR